MPTYVYECSACRKAFEVEQRITEAALTDCQCGAKGTVKRVIQPIAVMFKGAGFHINDYAPSSGGPAKPGSNEEKPAEATAPEAKTETPAPAAAASEKAAE